MADVFAPQPVKTKTNGDVVASIVDSAGTNKAGVSAAGAVQVSLANHAANATAVKVDGTGGTFPISGSLTANQSVNVAQVNGVTPLMGNGVTGTGSQRVTIASDNTAFAVNATLQTGAATIGALVANQTINLAQVNGVATSTGNGVSGTGVQRVTLASDSTGQVTLAAGSATIGALTANQTVNVAQMGGVATAMGAGTTSTGTQRVVLATDQTSIPVSTGLSGTVVDDALSSTALAAGANVTLDSTQIASGTGSLVEVTASSSVALKVEVGTWDGTTFTIKRTFFTSSITPSLIYIPQRYDEIQKATGATAKFRIRITNMDNANAADVYASTTYWR
jgi:filamentous hemagglutinin